MENKNSFSILLFVRRGRANKKGEVPIYSRITINGTTSEFAIGRSIEIDQWNKESNKAKGTSPNAKQLNNYLDIVRSKILRHHQELVNEGEVLTAKRLKFRYSGKDQRSRGIISTFKDHNEKISKLVNIDIAPATLQRYETTLKHVSSFIKKQYKTADINLNQIKYGFIEEFDFYLKTERNCANNTSVKYIKNFKKIINLAIRNEWLDRDPFAKYKSKLNEVKIEFLSQQELKIIENLKIEILRTDLVRDLFLFSCYTGLAFGDLNDLTKDKIQTDDDGTIWIRTHRKKTKNASNIPLQAKPLELINKYKDHPLVEGSNRILPKITNQKMNSYLKEIADLCIITKPLHSHIARHTFATTVTLAKGVPIEAVSKMLGHSSINMTQKYAKVLDTFVKSEMKKLNNNPK